jgi:hypothetical protein
LHDCGGEGSMFAREAEFSRRRDPGESGRRRAASVSSTSTSRLGVRHSGDFLREGGRPKEYSAGHCANGPTGAQECPSVQGRHGSSTTTRT